MADGADHGGELPGFSVPVHRALTEHILLGGAPRSIAILNGTLAGAVGLGLRLWLVGLAIWAIGHFAAVWAAKRDPLFVEVGRRHLRVVSQKGSASRRPDNLGSGHEVFFKIVRMQFHKTRQQVVAPPVLHGNPAAYGRRARFQGMDASIAHAKVPFNNGVGRDHAGVGDTIFTRHDFFLVADEKRRQPRLRVLRRHEKYR